MAVAGILGIVVFLVALYNLFAGEGDGFSRTIVLSFVFGFAIYCIAFPLIYKWYLKKEKKKGLRYEQIVVKYIKETAPFGLFFLILFCKDKRWKKMWKDYRNSL